MLKGIKVPHRKNTSECKAIPIPTPDEVVIPMSMHIGAPAKPVVKPGDEVKVGQLIAESGGFVSSPVYASVSGKVKKIDEVIGSAGRYTAAIFIQSDGKQTTFEGITQPKIETREDFINAVRDSGVVGLGGAGFPTAVKLTVKDIAQVEYVIINGAECEPYITSDTQSMIKDADYIWDGVLMIKKFFQPKEVILGIEENKPQCIKLFKERCSKIDGAEVRTLPSFYPQGGEKVLIFNTTGRIVPEGKLPLDVGAIVLNCTTLASIMKYIKTGMPLVEKCITVDGSAVSNPKNVIVPIGTHMQDVFDFCGGFKSDPKKVLYGGPMMGIAVPDLFQPILKSTNAILAFDENDAKVPDESPCIGCGRCIAHCPLRLMPADINRAFLNNNMEALEDMKVNICMECGCCSFVCPANRQLVQVNKMAKAALRQYQSEKKSELQKANTAD